MRMKFKNLFKPKTQKLVTSAKIFIYSDIDDASIESEDSIKGYMKKVAYEHGFLISEMDVDSIGYISVNPVTEEKIRVRGKYAKVNTLKHTFEIYRETEHTKKKIKECGVDHLFLSEDDEIKDIINEINDHFDPDSNKKLFESEYVDFNSELF